MTNTTAAQISNAALAILAETDDEATAFALARTDMWMSSDVTLAAWVAWARNAIASRAAIDAQFV